MSKTIYLGTDVCGLCDRGCWHCIHSSDMTRGGDIQFDIFGLLSEDLKRRRYKNINLEISGGGEPMLKKDLPEILDFLFGQFGNKLAVCLNTSGVLSDNKEEEERLVKILHDCPKRNIRLRLSFNLFNRTFSQRLSNTLRIVAERTKLTEVVINMCLSFRNAQKTHEEFYKALNKRGEVATDPFLVFDGTPDDGLDAFVIEDEYFETKVWSKERLELLTMKAYCYDSLNFMFYRGKRAVCLPITSGFVKRRGRAINIYDRISSVNLHSCEVLTRGAWDELSDIDCIYISSKGFYHPAFTCINRHEMNIGKIGEVSIKDALRQKRIIRSSMHGRLLLEEATCTIDNICDACSRIKCRCF